MAIDINSLIKQYANPWDTSYSYLDPTGNILGKGYDSYEDAIRKLSFTSGLKQYDPREDLVGYGINNVEGMTITPGSPGGYGFSGFNVPAIEYSKLYPGLGVSPDVPEQTGNLFDTKEDLYNWLMSDPLGKDMISYESKDKYGRPLVEGQLQNMYLNYIAGNLSGKVPDWDDHRAAYESFAPSRITGEQALVGSTPVFGDDGKITGYKVNLNPAHYNFSDTSGRVQSSSGGSTQFDQNLRDYALPVDANTAFIPVQNIDKFGYTSGGGSSYNKEDTGWSKLGEALTKGFIGTVAGGALGFGPLAGGQAAGATGGSMFEGLGDWFSELFSSAPEALGEAGGYNFLSNEVIGELPQLLGDLGGYGAEGQSVITQALDYVKNNPGSTLKTAINALSNMGQIPAGLLSSLGGYLSGEAAQDAAQTSANTQLEAARIAADAAKFKPVGVTTRFGQSQFTKDAQGNVVSAGYTMPADIKAMQDSLIGAAPGMLSQFTGSQATTAPMGDAAQRMMSLGNQYLAADPQAQAQKFYDQQQAIMATERARQEADTLTGEFNRGTYGLATGGTGMMGAANPRMEALYNAQRQQDLQAAYDATKGGQQYATFGSGLVGAGGDMLQNMYRTQSASYDPYKTAMGGAQYLEGLGQNALDLSVNMGKVASPAQSGQLLAQGMLGAANTMQPANAYSPWGTALMNAGNALSSMGQPQQQQATYDPTRFQLVPFGT